MIRVDRRRRDDCGGTLRFVAISVFSVAEKKALLAAGVSAYRFTVWSFALFERVSKQQSSTS